LRTISILVVGLAAVCFCEGIEVRSANACGVKLTAKSRRMKHKQVGAKQQPTAVAVKDEKPGRKLVDRQAREVVAAGPDARASGRIGAGSDERRRIGASSGGSVEATASPRSEPRPEPRPEPPPARVESTPVADEPAPERVARAETKPKRPKADRPKAGRPSPEPAEPVAALQVEIYFDSGSSLVASEAQLQEVVEWLAANPSGRIVLTGHADPTGSAAFNLRLSQRRAAAVKQFLLEKAQVSGGRIRVVGKGETQVAYPDDLGKNRRVNIRNR
jgi:outer membrane protein OmpA-like peptidoglycan-associated protein